MKNRNCPNKDACWDYHASNCEGCARRKYGVQGMTRLEQEKRKKWLLDYIRYEEREDEEARQLAFENMSNMSYYEFQEWAVQKGYIKKD